MVSTTQGAFYTGGDHAARRERARLRVRRLSRLLDHAVRIPGLRVPVGLDAALGLVPGFGDVASALLGGWMIYEAHQLGAPKRALARMCGNLAFDTILGSVPLVGDVFDVFFRANQRNYRLLRRYTGET